MTAGRPSELTYNAAGGHTEAQIVQKGAVPIAFGHVSDFYDFVAEPWPDRDHDAVQLGNPCELCSLCCRQKEGKASVTMAHRV